MNGLRFHFYQQIRNCLTGIDCDVDRGLPRSQSRFQGIHSSDVAAQILGDCERSRVVFWTVHTQARGDTKLNFFHYLVRFRQTLRRDHCARVGVDGHSHNEFLALAVCRGHDTALGIARTNARFVPGITRQKTAEFSRFWIRNGI